jgi:hypothetical protein
MNLFCSKPLKVHLIFTLLNISNRDNEIQTTACVKGKELSAASPKASPLFQLICCDLEIAGSQSDHCEGKEAT